jgi:exopolyphosphatase/guanosine-5'-triphosphate,3'-diphosphate pyrophosphatase
MIRASIDLGTNTCLLLVVDWDAQAQVMTRVLRDDAQVVRLGEGVDQNRRLQPAAMDRVKRCLGDYAQKVESLGIRPQDVVCVATSQARDAENAAEFFQRLRTDLGFVFETISGETEARLTFQGALLPGMRMETSVVVDIGGGSTELISASRAQSVDLGSVRFTERYLHSDPVTDAEFWACQEAIDQTLESFLKWRSSLSPQCALVGVAGTVTTLAAWHLDLAQFDAQTVDGCVLSRGDIHRMVEELKWRTVAERCALPGMEPLRADVILAGALILWRVLEVLQFPELVVSTRGLRYGALRGLS